MVQFEKFRELATSKKITILPFKTCFYNYQEQLKSYSNIYDFEKFIFNNEFIKINSLNLYEQVKNYIIKILLKTNDKESLELLNKSVVELINSTVAILYKITYIRTYEEILINYQKSKDLKNLNNLNDNNFNSIIINHYKTRFLNKYEKLRYFYNFISKKIDKETNQDLLYALYWICTKSEKITITDKELFFNELVKIWEITTNTAINNCMMYFIWYIKLKKNKLNKPKRTEHFFEKIFKIRRIE